MINIGGGVGGVKDRKIRDKNRSLEVAGEEADSSRRRWQETEGGWRVGGGWGSNCLSYVHVNYRERERETEEEGERERERERERRKRKSISLLWRMTQRKLRCFPCQNKSRALNYSLRVPTTSRCNSLNTSIITHFHLLILHLTYIK